MIKFLNVLNIMFGSLSCQDFSKVSFSINFTMLADMLHHVMKVRLYHPLETLLRLKGPLSRYTSHTSVSEDHV